MIPGEYFLKEEEVICNNGKAITSLAVVNTGDRPIQVGSHYHFFEVNRQMQFDRQKAFGKRLNIASGTAVRFEPGEETEVNLISIGGKGIAYGFNNLTDGKTGVNDVEAALKNMDLNNFKNISDEPTH